MDNKKSIILVIAIIYLLGVFIYFGYNWLNKLDSNVKSNTDSISREEELYNTVEDPNEINRIAHEYMNSREYDKARRFLLKAAEKKQKNAINTLGCIYLEGLGVPKDYKRALELFKAGASKGDPEAERFPEQEVSVDLWRRRLGL